MPAKVKLTYFGCKGRGEVIRLILAAAGVEYEDIRLQKSDWPSVRKSKCELKLCARDEHFLFSWFFRFPIWTIANAGI